MNFIPSDINWTWKQTRDLQHWKQEFIQGNHRHPTDQEMIRKVNEILESIPSHGIRDGFVYRPTRAECPFNCDQCGTIQNKNTVYP